MRLVYCKDGINTTSVRLSHPVSGSDNFTEYAIDKAHLFFAREIGIEGNTVFVGNGGDLNAYVEVQYSGDSGPRLERLEHVEVLY